MFEADFYLEKKQHIEKKHFDFHCSALRQPFYPLSCVSVATYVLLVDFSLIIRVATDWITLV
jgi:hypothetical protein